MKTKINRRTRAVRLRLCRLFQGVPESKEETMKNPNPPVKKKPKGRKPKAIVEMAKPERDWMSDCGEYIARRLPGAYWPAFDIAHRTSGRVWRHNRYVPKGFDDKDRRFTHPEFPHETVGYSLVDSNNSGSVIAFTISFADMNTRKKIKPWTGNAILAKYEATFRKRIARREGNALITPLKSERPPQEFSRCKH